MSSPSLLKERLGKSERKTRRFDVRYVPSSCLTRVVDCAQPAMSKPSIKNAVTVVCLMFIIVLLSFHCSISVISTVLIIPAGCYHIVTILSFFYYFFPVISDQIAYVLKRSAFIERCLSSDHPPICPASFSDCLLGFIFL